MRMNFVFLANDPGGADSLLPVAKAIEMQAEAHVKVLLSGKAEERLPIYKTTKEDTLLFLEQSINNNDDFVLITGTSWNSTIELEAIKLCKDNSIITISILDYWSNYIERFVLYDDYVFPDYLFLMDQMAYDEAVASGINSEIIRIVGTPGLDCYVNRNTKRKSVLFLSQPLSAIKANSNDGYNEFDAFEGVLKACNELNLSIDIKFHPKETDEMKRTFADYQVEGDLIELVNRYDVVVGMNSMGLLQCALMDIPIISFEPNLLTDDKCITNKLNISKCITSYEDLVDQLKILTGTIRNDSKPFWFDGKSTNRCVQELFQIINDREK